MPLPHSRLYQAKTANKQNLPGNGLFPGKSLVILLFNIGEHLAELDKAALEDVDLYYIICFVSF